MTQSITDDLPVQPTPLRVVIAEDSVLIREGISRLIEESGGTAPIGSMSIAPNVALTRRSARCVAVA